MNRTLPQRWAGWACGLLLVAGGLWVRLDRLGGPSFDADEYRHLFAAQSLNENGQPLNPGGEPYKRALIYTAMVALSFRVTGAVNEFTARLPSVVIDVGVFAIIFLVSRAWFGAPAAFIAVSLLLFSPWWILLAKTCRMYTFLNLVHVTSAWAAWQALEGRGRHRWLWAAFSLGAVAIGFGAHKLSVGVLPSLAVFILLQACLTRSRFYMILSVAGLAAVSLLEGTGAVNFENLWRRVNFAPAWAEHSRFDYSYYLRTWWAMYPVLLVLYPVSILHLWRRNRDLGLFLLCLGLVPFGLHSIVFDWKLLRYLLYTLPWLMIPSAVLLADWLRGVWSGRVLWRRFAALALALGALVPWAGQVTATPGQFPSVAWRGYYDWLRPQLEPGDAVLSSMALPTLYYLGRPASYIVNNILLPDADPAEPGSLYRRTYWGAPMVITKQELEDVVAKHRRGWIVVEAYLFEPGVALTAEAHAYVVNSMERTANGVEAYLGRPVVMYRWER